jgi:hypothetical protein
VRRGDVLVATKDVIRVVLSLQSLEAREIAVAECGPHTFERFVRLHVVDLTVDLQRVRPREIKGGRDVVRVDATRDHGRAGDRLAS